MQLTKVLDQILTVTPVAHSVAENLPRRNAALLSAVEMQSLSPEQLAAEARNGNDRAFEVLVEQFHGRIFGYLHQITSNAHDAEDLTQDTFVKAYRALSRYAPTLSFPGWLFTIAKRTALNHLRSRRPTSEFDDAQIDERTPAGHAESKDAELSVWRVARTLKPNQHEILWLHFAEGFSLSEVSRVMNISSIHARVLLHRARKNLAGKLRKLETTENSKAHF